MKITIHDCYINSINFGILADSRKELACDFGPCKEFILDTAWATIKNSPYANKRISLEDVPIVAGKILNISAVRDFLHDFEGKINFQKTVITELKDNIYLFNGEKRWMIAPPMLSLFPLLIRCGICYNKPESYEETFVKAAKIPCSYTPLTDIPNAMRAIIEHTPEKIFGIDLQSNWPNANEVHNNWGIASLATGLIPKKEWYRSISKEKNNGHFKPRKTNE